MLDGSTERRLTLAEVETSKGLDGQLTDVGLHFRLIVFHAMPEVTTFWEKCAIRFAPYLHVTKQLSKLKTVATPKNEEFIKRYYQLFSNPENPDAQEWENIYFAANFLHDNFKNKLTATFPKITEDDIKMCCLIRIGFNTNEVAFAMNLSPHTIHKRKTALRKKLDMPEASDIIEFLESCFK